MKYFSVTIEYYNILSKNLPRTHNKSQLRTFFCIKLLVSYKKFSFLKTKCELQIFIYMMTHMWDRARLPAAVLRPLYVAEGWGCSIYESSYIKICNSEAGLMSPYRKQESLLRTISTWRVLHYHNDKMPSMQTNFY